MEQNERLQKAIERAGLNPMRLSIILGYSRYTVYKWIRGKSQPNAGTMLKLTKILRISAQEVLEMFTEGGEDE